MRRVLGSVAGLIVLMSLAGLVVIGVPRLPLPFVLILLVGAVGSTAGVKGAFIVRAWIDPTFDPALSAHRRF